MERATGEKMVRTYQTSAERDRDADAFATEGWAIHSTTLLPPLRASKAYLLTRWFRGWTGGTGEPPAAEIVVTYTRK